MLNITVLKFKESELVNLKQIVPMQTLKGQKNTRISIYLNSLKNIKSH